MQLQEDLKKQLSTEGHYTEEELEAYMQPHKSVMVDSLWKLNVADIEATLSHVCQMVCFHVLSTSYFFNDVSVSILNSFVVTYDSGFNI
jgi:hypothetical protein